MMEVSKSSIERVVNGIFNIKFESSSGTATESLSVTLATEELHACEIVSLSISFVLQKHTILNLNFSLNDL